MYKRSRKKIKMEESELNWHVMEKDLWPTEQKTEYVKNKEEDFVERCDKPMLIKEAEDLIKERAIKRKHK